MNKSLHFFYKTTTKSNTLLTKLNLSKFDHKSELVNWEKKILFHFFYIIKHNKIISIKSKKYNINIFKLALKFKLKDSFSSFSKNHSKWHKK